MNHGNSSATGKAIRSILRKIGWGLFTIIMILGLRQIYSESPLRTIGLVGSTAVILGLCFLLIYSAAITGFFWSRGHYRIAGFFLKYATPHPNQSPQAQTLLGDLYFHGLGRPKDWARAAVHYGRVLALDTAAQEAMIAAIGPLLAADALINWADPACLPHLQAIAASGHPEAARALEAWSRNRPFNRA